ncbi:MAG: hypothetical protein IKH75_08175 [Ruminococcus sp.]|nr:hypothetical protein [Ruminococcus sp.]
MELCKYKRKIYFVVIMFVVITFFIASCFLLNSRNTNSSYKQAVHDLMLLISDNEADCDIYINLVDENECFIKIFIYLDGTVLNQLHRAYDINSIVYTYLNDNFDTSWILQIKYYSKIDKNYVGKLPDLDYLEFSGSNQTGINTLYYNVDENVEFYKFVNDKIYFKNITHLLIGSKVKFLDYSIFLVFPNIEQLSISNRIIDYNENINSYLENNPNIETFVW